jgi:serine/threonine-protein kinase RsbW
MKRKPIASPSRPGRWHLEKRKLALRFLEVIPSTFEAMEGVLTKLMALASEMKCGGDHLQDIELALREALANAIVHGNRQDPKQKVVVRCYCQPDRGMLLAVEDEGAGFDPTKVPDPTHAERLLETHGRGLFLIRQVVDRVRISRSGRRVTMVKYIRS